jgi:hypothetical protein
VTSVFSAVLAAALACGVCGLARAAPDDDDSAGAAPAAASSATVFPPRPAHVVMTDTNSDAGKVFHAKGGRDKAVVPGGAVIIDASGNRLEIAPTKRPAAATLAAPAPAAKPALPALPTLDNPKAGLAKRRRRAEHLLAASVAAAYLLLAWARRRWRPDV